MWFLFPICDGADQEVFLLEVSCELSEIRCGAVVFKGSIDYRPESR